MYIAINYETSKEYVGYNASGDKLYRQMKKSVETQLDNYIGVDGKIDGTRLQDDWFPDIEADIFLSHSHKDIDLAISFAGYLYREFGLVTFIDYCLWGYCDRLLKQIDDKYCWNSGNETYNYTKRNYSTSHVHMMLSNALTKMIDKTECLIFLNTNNSLVSTENIIKDERIQKTNSPWIYSELATATVIRKNLLEPIGRNQKFKENIEKKEYFEHSAQIEYDVNKYLDKFYRIDDTRLTTWERMNVIKDNKKLDALDNLYSILIK